MTIYPPHECKKMIERLPWNKSNNCLIETCFCPKDGLGKLLATIPVAEVSCKMYQHNVGTIINTIRGIVANYQAAEQIADSLFIYMLPYPPHYQWGVYQNADAIDEHGFILYPRGTPIPKSFTRQIVAHEFGHMIQDFLCPLYTVYTTEDGYQQWGKNPLWGEYLKLRGYNKTIITHDMYRGKTEELNWRGDGLDWHERPEEWFAEDFRWIYSDGQEWVLENLSEPKWEIARFFQEIGKKA